MRRTSRKYQPPRETELILDHDYYDHDVSSGPKWLRALQIVAAVAFVVALLLYRGGYLNEAARDWTGLGLGIALLFMLVGDIRNGRPSIWWAWDYRRSSDPVGFWVIIVFSGLIDVALILGSLGDLLGVWQLPS